MDGLELQQHKLEHFEWNFGIDRKLKKSNFGTVEPCRYSFSICVLIEKTS